MAHAHAGAVRLGGVLRTVQEVCVTVYVQTEIAVAPQPCAGKECSVDGMSDDDLLGYGVPGEWLKDIKKATADTLRALTDHLPAEAAEALLELATGHVTVLTDGILDDSPSFAPNGKMILYEAQVGGRGQLAAVSGDGRVRQRLTSAAGDVQDPAWGPMPTN